MLEINNITTNFVEISEIIAKNQGRNQFIIQNYKTQQLGDQKTREKCKKIVKPKIK